MYAKRNGRPRGIRRRASGILTTDPRTGEPVLMPEKQTSFIRAADGSLDSFELQLDRYVCRCHPSSAPGGFCNVCGGLACSACTSRCMSCRRCLCPAHAFHVRIQTGDPRTPATLCRRCRGRFRARAAGRRIFRFLTSPFIDWSTP